MRLILLLIVACLAAWGALQIDAADPHNYVKLYLLGYSIEASVLGFLLLLLLAVIVLYFLVWLARQIWRSPRSLANWQGRRNQAQAHTGFGSGYLSLIKGDWKRAEQQLTLKPEHSSVPYVNFLAAAQAAQEQGKLAQRDKYLAAAFDSAPKERLAIGLTKARLHQQARQMDQALTTLQDIAVEGKKNPQYTAMLLQTHEQAKQWSKAKELLPLARKQKALPEPVLQEIDNRIHHSALQRSQDIHAAWRALPKEQKRQLPNVKLAAQSMLQQGDVGAAEKLLRQTLKNQWSDDLVALYGTIKSDKPARELRRVEGWLMARPESAESQLAAGRLAAAAGKKDIAREYLQKAISLAQLPGAYALLGELYEAGNESGKALQLYRNAMHLISAPTASKALPNAEPGDAGSGS